MNIAIEPETKKAPLPFNDPTAGLELVTGEAVQLEATRHLFLAADLLDPARKRDIGLTDGGEEMRDIDCLRRTNGLLPRCQITPLEMWGKALPAEFFPDGVRLDYKVKNSLFLPPDVTEAMPTGSYDPRAMSRAPLYFMPTFPGDQIKSILGPDTHTADHGVVELSALRGVQYGKEDRELQQLFFGDWPIPVALRLIRERIEAVAERNVGDVQDVAADMLRSCDVSEEYLNSVVSLANTQLDTRVLFQHTYSLTPKVRHYMAQLELKPRATHVTAIEEKVQQVAASGVSAEQLEQILTQAFTTAIRLVKETEVAPAVESPTE